MSLSESSTIALHKGTYSCTHYPIDHFISYDFFHLTYHTFARAMSFKL